MWPVHPAQVRVWWPPTKDSSRTGFSGAYWPATVVAVGSKKVEVQYDNGEIIKEPRHNITTLEGLEMFGQEHTPMLVRQ
jgi:hypothetical protein